MLIKTRGIILRSTKYSETSIITDIYTEAKGLRTYIISGVRSKKAKVKASLLQVMSLVEMVAYHRDERDMHRIKEIKSAYVFTSIPFDIIKGAVGLFMVELTRKTIRESEENHHMFIFLFESFRLLDTTPYPVSNFHIAFMIELSGLLGFMPEGDFSKSEAIFDLEEGVFTAAIPNHTHYLKEDLSQLLNQFLHTAIWDAHQIDMDRRTRKRFLHELLQFYRLHIENFPEINAHQILEEVLEG